MPLRAAVTGGRGFSDRAFVFATFDALHAQRGVSVLISGRCPTGADAHAEAWAEARGIPVEPYPARWEDLVAPGAVVRHRSDGTPYNVLAGFQRNQRMVDEAAIGVLVAFPGGSGTADMAHRCLDAVIEIIDAPPLVWFSVAAGKGCGAVGCSPAGVVVRTCPLYRKMGWVGKPLNDIIRKHRPACTWSRL